MRYLFFALVGTACSDWTANVTPLPPDCFALGEALPFFPDADNDQWGDATAEPVLACAPGEIAGADVQNRLDCDDNSETIGPRLGAVCPELPVNGAALDGPVSGDLTQPHAVVGFVGDRREYVVLGGVNDATWSQTAETWCSAWGGSLANFASMGDFNRFSSEMNAEVYPLYLGAVPEGGHWRWLRADEVRLAEGETRSAAQVQPERVGDLIDPGAINLCANGLDGATPTDHLALRQQGGGLCMGVVKAAQANQFSQAHFVCSRLKGDPSQWEVKPDAL